MSRAFLFGVGAGGAPQAGGGAVAVAGGAPQAGGGAAAVAGGAPQDGGGAAGGCDQEAGGGAAGAAMVDVLTACGGGPNPGIEGGAPDPEGVTLAYAELISPYEGGVGAPDGDGL